MIFKKTTLPDIYLVDLDRYEDKRGFFARYFCKKEFSKRGLNAKWVQINNSMNKKIGTLRGLHFQKYPNSEVKLVRCIKGSVWDVVVDLRKNSKTFGKWFGSKLTEVNRRMMYVPKGFAHGFISLKPYSEIIYLASDYYEPNLEVTLHWNDPDIAIKWPIKPRIISKKDSSGLLLRVYKKLKS
jgi:dTDP-4-dehydrorhamnose 3,5-epimerase